MAGLIKWAGSRLDKLKALATAGKTTAQAAREFGLSAQNISEAAYRHGVSFDKGRGIWDAPSEHILVKLWPDHTALHIAGVLGVGFTRAAVCGKAMRLDLPRKDTKFKPSGRPPAPRKPRASRAMPKAEKAAQRKPRAKQPRKVDQAPRKKAPIPKAIRQPGEIRMGRALVDLTAQSCRWPLDDPNPIQLFCGDPKDGSSSYCCEHHARAVVPTKTTPRELVRSVRRYA